MTNDDTKTPQPRRRKLLSGTTVPQATIGRTWHELIVPGPGATGGAKANPKHPSRKHDTTQPVTAITPPVDVAAPTPGQARRRNRRTAARHALRHHEVGGAVGGGEEESICACGATFTAPTRDLLSEATTLHYGLVAA